MTTRSTKYNSVKMDVDIEKCREEQNWLKVIQLAEQLKEKERSPYFEYLANFLIGEGKLEKYLEEWPPIEANIHRAKIGLMEAKQFLELACSSEGNKADVALDSLLLLGKMYYACGQYSDSLNSFKSADLDALSEKKLPLRSLRMVAESFAIRALCNVKVAAGASKFKKAEKDDETLRSFEIAADLTLLYTQELEKQQYTGVSGTGTHSPQPPAGNKVLSPILEQSLHEAPSMLLRQGKPIAALERYRVILSSVESQAVHTIRLKCLCQLAELILRGTVSNEYKPPTLMTKDSAWKPKQYSSLNQFVPKNECEESILVLLVAEAMAVRHTVLSQSAEFKEARLNAYHNATLVYDLLTLATVRWGQFALLQESFERAMKFSFEESHVWRQHALSLITAGRYVDALGIFKEVIRLEPNQSVNCLLVARLCYEHLNLPFEGTEFSMEAKKMEFSHSTGLLGRCYLYIGIGYQLQSRNTNLKQEEQVFNECGLKYFNSALEIEPNDHLSEFYLGLQLAIMGRISEALSHVQTALDLRSESSSTLHLLALLLSANSQHVDALEVVEAALQEYPDCLNLMYVKAYLELHLDGGEKALVTGKQMLELWKTLYEGQISSDVPECDRRSDTRSVFQLYTSEMSDKDSSSLQAHSMAASRVEHALSEVASSISSFSPRPGPQRAWLLQMEVWLLLAEIYLTLDEPAYVQQCIQEATQIYPLSHHIMHMRGVLHMYKKEWSEAKLCFQNAVAINPQHIKSLQQLGLVYCYMGSQGLAESTLREAAKIDPKNHITWYNLGKVLEALGEYEDASNCMATALNVETTSPILPFTSVPLCFE
ncbi:hypothetical protein RI129_002003 [Pyrocoelia pectoralis]|uniref:Tetratricopeptide repeat protein 7 N-terminal domain-containing protein n=1 Tax=Pyrocoelia pectoralis TaxID=417401 RepID=A0AAN7W119_9COLE